jgi:hypothetical protein
MICKKCNQDKPDTEYQTYFHSTQNVYRTRRQCTQCFNEAKKQYHLKKNGRQCIVCEDFKYEIDFPNFKSLGPNDKRRKVCKICTSRIEREKGKHTKREENGERVHWKPNTYNSTEQKELAFEVMTVLGFTFDENTGRWHKDGFKNTDGTFFRIEEKKRLERERILKEVEELDIWKKIRYLRDKDISINEISRITGVNYTAVHKFIQYGKEVNYRDTTN